MSKFPKDFLWGGAIAANQAEGGWNEGDVVIVNDNLKHYRGEIQIVLKDMEVDGQRNLLGRIAEEEIMILDHIKANDAFTFME